MFRPVFVGNDSVGVLMAVIIKQQLKFDPEIVWAIVGTPDRVDWVPGVKDCVFDGEVRTLSLPGAGRIKERILSRNAESMTMEYSCFESPMPLEQHHAHIEVRPAPDGCELIWTTTIKPEAIEKFIRQSKEGAIAQLLEILGKHSE
jgi:hypothetical protein